MFDYFLFLVNQNVAKATEVYIYEPLSKTLLKFTVCPSTMG